MLGGQVSNEKMNKFSASDPNLFLLPSISDDLDDQSKIIKKCSSSTIIANDNDRKKSFSRSSTIETTETVVR